MTLDELRELSERATAGPWRSETKWTVQSPANEGHHWVCEIDSQWGASKHGNDAALICAAVNLIRLMLSDAGVEVMARAHDVEDAAQMGEPSPWTSVSDPPTAADKEWMACRLAAHHAAIDALCERAMG